MTTILKIVDYLSKGQLLRRVARDVRSDEINTDAFQAFVHSMVATMTMHRGLGLASTQVEATAPDGTVWAVVVLQDTTQQRAGVLLNPKITERSDLRWSNEACLSFRSVPVLLRQPHRVVFTTMGEDGKTTEVVATEREAVCVFHEVEHLHGKTLLDRMRPGERQKFLTKVAKVRRP
jgi:peptide deformylase